MNVSFPRRGLAYGIFWALVIIPRAPLAAEPVKVCSGAEITAVRVVAAERVQQDYPADMIAFPEIFSTTMEILPPGDKSFEVVLSVPVRSSYTLLDALPTSLSRGRGIEISCTDTGIELNDKMIFTPKQNTERPRRYKIEVELTLRRPKIITVEAKWWLITPKQPWWQPGAMDEPITNNTEVLTIRKTVPD